MEMNLTQLCDLDPMNDDTKILARCISIWKSYPLGKPNEVWSLDAVFQDQQLFSVNDRAKPPHDEEVGDETTPTILLVSSRDRPRNSRFELFSFCVVAATDYETPDENGGLFGLISVSDKYAWNSIVCALSVEGEDGSTHLYYILLKDAIDVALEMKFITKTPGHEVRGYGALVIKSYLKDAKSGKVIMNNSCKFKSQLSECSVGNISGIAGEDCCLDLKVDWEYQS
ncbi:hypothetical protein Tco_0158369 [Tanacetum coccineum]